MQSEVGCDEPIIGFRQVSVTARPTLELLVTLARRWSGLIGFIIRLLAIDLTPSRAISLSLRLLRSMDQNGISFKNRSRIWYALGLVGLASLRNSEGG